MRNIIMPKKRPSLLGTLTEANALDLKLQFNYGGMIDSDPVCDYGEKILKDRDNADSSLMREASMAGAHLRAFARGAKINLNRREWIDPASLGGRAEKLADIFNRNVFTPAYRAWEDKCSLNLARHLVTRNQFSDILQYWPRYNDRQRIDATGWLSREQQKIFAQDLMTPAITCAHGFAEARSQPPHPRIVRGFHRSPGHGRRSHEMGFNTHIDAGFSILPRALEVIFHENLHASQYALAAHAASGDIGPDHPLHREARLFAMGFACKESYISSVDPVYRAHPLEADTHPQSDRFLKILGVTLQENGLPPLSGP